jgi:hypothetical protein
MNKLTLFLACFFLFSLSKITAQVAAGVTDNLVIGQKSVQLPVFAPNSGDYDIRHDSLDFDGDGKYDALFTAEAAWVADYSGGFTGIQALHPGFALMADSSDFVRPLAAGDSINAAQDWSVSNLYQSPFVTRFWGITGQLQQYGNWMPPNSTAYVGFRVITAQQDTLYGWFRVTASANPNFPSASITVNGLWAIEAPTSSDQPVDFIIAGATSDLVPGNQTIVLEQGPIPFGGAAGKVVSLDLNQDDIKDIFFQVLVNNTFDHMASTTSFLSMHDGFSFVNGPLYARQFENGDAIFSNANWALSVGSDLASQGVGLNGFQSAGEWLNDNEGYLGFRLVTPTSDTLFGWIHIYAYSLAENGAYLEVLGWAIQHDPSQKPYVEVAKTPEKPVYCKGDYVMFEANAVGAEQIMWHFWDGSTDTSNVVVKILPDSTVTATFEATNQNGTTTVAQTLEVSPLTLTVPDFILDCAHPTATLIAETNIPADICWVVGNDTTCNPTPPQIDFPGPVTVIAEDQYGCIAVEYVEILLDANVPVVFIEYDEENHLLIAHSSTPGVTFYWTSTGWSVANDSVFITESGTYTVVATAPNGCTATASIDIIITSTGEPFAGNVMIQPNPASQFLQIENRLAADLYFKIFDTAGSLKIESGTATANSLVRLDVEFLPAGFYFLAACDAAGKPLFFKKFVKQ